MNENKMQFKKLYCINYSVLLSNLVYLNRSLYGIYDKEGGWIALSIIITDGNRQINLGNFPNCDFREHSVRA